MCSGVTSWLGGNRAVVAGVIEQKAPKSASCLARISGRFLDSKASERFGGHSVPKPVLQKVGLLGVLAGVWFGRCELEN